MILAAALLLGIQSPPTPTTAERWPSFELRNQDPADGQVIERLLVVLPAQSAKEAALSEARELVQHSQLPLEVTAIQGASDDLTEFERWCAKNARERRIVYATRGAESIVARWAARRPDSIAAVVYHSGDSVIAPIDGVELIRVGGNRGSDPRDEVIAALRTARLATEMLKLDRKSVAAVLDDFHAAAAAADADRYFGHFAPEGVFLGTDALERWTVAEFRAYCEPYFSQGKGWKYEPRSRNVDFGASRDQAWFDELLWNEKYGECRGSGVLRRTAGGWKIQQYNLTFTVPNDKAARVVDVIRGR